MDGANTLELNDVCDRGTMVELAPLVVVVMLAGLGDGSGTLELADRVAITMVEFSGLDDSPMAGGAVVETFGMNGIAEEFIVDVLLVMLSNEVKAAMALRVPLLDKGAGDMLGSDVLEFMFVAVSMVVLFMGAGVRLGKLPVLFRLTSKAS